MADTLMGVHLKEGRRVQGKWKVPLLRMLGMCNKDIGIVDEYKAGAHLQV